MEDFFCVSTEMASTIGFSVPEIVIVHISTYVKLYFLVFFFESTGSKGAQKNDDPLMRRFRRNALNFVTV